MEGKKVLDDCSNTCLMILSGLICGCADKHIQQLSACRQTLDRRGWSPLESRDESSNEKSFVLTTNAELLAQHKSTAWKPAWTLPGLHFTPISSPGLLVSQCSLRNGLIRIAGARMPTLTAFYQQGRPPHHRMTPDCRTCSDLPNTNRFGQDV